MVRTFDICSCCRRESKNPLEEPYGVISHNGGSAKHQFTSVLFHDFASDLSRNAVSLSQSRSIQSNTKGKIIPLAIALPTSKKRALPELPSSISQTQNDRSTDPIYSVVFSHQKTGIVSVPFSTEAINPTYESIDAESDSQSDPIYSVLETKQKTNRRYDYPVFTSNCAGNDTVYQSASQLYTGGSEDPYSSINSNVGEKNYDLNYGHINENIPAESHSASCHSSRPSTSKNLDHLYTQIKRNPCSTANSNLTNQRFSPSPIALQNSNGSPLATTKASINQKVSREPSYRYITVRESIDIIRQRISQREEELRRILSVSGGSKSAIRDHYYSSIGGDYESVPNPNVEAPERQLLSQIGDIGLMSAKSQQDISFAPKPPTSPIPDRNKKSHILSSDDVCPYSSPFQAETYRYNRRNNTMERIRKLRSNFFNDINCGFTVSNTFHLFSAASGLVRNDMKSNEQELSTQPKKNSKEILVDLQTNKGETSTDLGRIQFSHAMRVEAVLPNAGENIVSKVANASLPSLASLYLSNSGSSQNFCAKTVKRSATLGTLNDI